MKIYRYIFFLFTLYAPFISYSQTPDSMGVYSFVPVPPVFKEGEQALFKFIKESVKYPADALHEHKSGKVQLKFIINENGDVSEVKAVRGICPSLDAEAIRVVSLTSGKWESGKLLDKPVKTYKYLPLTFSIDTTADETESQKIEFIGGDSAFLAFIKNNVKIPRIVAEADLWDDSKIAISFDSSNKITSVISGPGQQDLNDEAIRLIKLTQGYWHTLANKNVHTTLTKVVTIHFTKDMIYPSDKNIVPMGYNDLLLIAVERDSLFGRAYHQFIQKDYRKSLSLFQECIEKKPDYSLARMMRGQCSWFLGRAEEACRDFSWLLNERKYLDPDIISIYRLICLHVPR